MVNASQLSLKIRTIPRFLYYEILCSTLIINHKNFLSKSLAAVKQSIGFVILSFKDQKSLALLRAPFILKALMEDWERARDGTQCLLQSLCPYSTALRNWALAMYACVCVKCWLGTLWARNIGVFLLLAGFGQSAQLCCQPHDESAEAVIQNKFQPVKTSVLSCCTTRISKKTLHLHGLVLKFHMANDFNLLDTSYFEANRGMEQVAKVFHFYLRYLMRWSQCFIKKRAL